MYSLLATCKPHEANPHAWLTDVLRRIPTHRAKAVRELLSHRWKRRRKGAGPTRSSRPATRWPTTWTCWPTRTCSSPSATACAWPRWPRRPTWSSAWRR
ncbi:MAG: transposase domain-containing protein, partial [Bacteroidetes bacterium]